MDFNEDTWHYDSWTSPYGISIPSEFLQNNPPPEGGKIKIGVIDFGFHEHSNLPGSTEIGNTKNDSGTHVAGIVGATTSHTRPTIMKGLCSSDSFELVCYVLPRYPEVSNETENPIESYYLRSFLDIFVDAKLTQYRLSTYLWSGVRWSQDCVFLTYNYR